MAAGCIAVENNSREQRRAEKRGLEMIEKMRADVARMHLGIGPKERYDALKDSIVRLSGKKHRRNIDINGFYHILQQWSFPIENAKDAFMLLDPENSGKIDVDHFVGAMIDGSGSALTAGSPCSRSHLCRAYMHDGGTGRGGYPEAPPTELHETNFLGSRGIERESRAATLGKAPFERAQQRQGRSLNDPVHLHNQHRNAAVISIADVVIDSLRQTIVQRGGSHGIHTLARILKRDADRDHRLSPAEMKGGLKDMGIVMDESDLRLLASACDRRGSGAITMDEFLSVVRGPISSSRRKIIDAVARGLDRNGNGEITLKDIQASFNPQYHPDVTFGRLGEDLALLNMVAQFDRLEIDGAVSRDEFCNYCKNLSAAIEDDNHFEAIMKRAWRPRK